MAKRCGFSRQTVSRIWRTFGLAPHRSESFTLSTDPYFIDKVRDVVGLYLDPPANALVLCVDEKTQVQALERSQPVLPMRPGRPERRTHDYYRHGTLSLFAALEVATGRVISATKPKHRSAEFLAFLRQVEKAVPAELAIHAILDNYATHKTEAVELWLRKHPRWQMHFIPTHSSWLNQVERFLPRSPTSASGAESFAASASCKQPSNPTSPTTTKHPNPSAGQPPPMPSWERSGLYVRNLRDTTLAAILQLKML